MVSTLKGELTNLHESMARYKEMAQETIILRAEVHSLTDVSTRKVEFHCRTLFLGSLGVVEDLGFLGF